MVMQFEISIYPVIREQPPIVPSLTAVTEGRAIDVNRGQSSNAPPNTAVTFGMGTELKLEHP